MARTNPTAVRAVIDTNPTLDVQQFIDVAGRLTDRVSTANTNKGTGLTEDDLLDIETYLAAHFYALRDPQYRGKGVGAASAQYVRATAGQRLSATDWGQQAIMLDSTGTLAAMDNGTQKLGITWLGSIGAEQVDFEDRD